MSTLWQAYWRQVRKRPLILFWSAWLRVKELWCRRFHLRHMVNFDGDFAFCRKCREERCLDD